MFSASLRTAAARQAAASTIRSSGGVRASYSTTSSRSAFAVKIGSKANGNGGKEIVNGGGSGSNVQRRFMGGDMPVPQSQNAPLWHGHTVQKEGWEETVYFYYAAGIILQAAVLLGAPETSIESWARPEAQARLVLKSQGQTEFEFGTHYQDLMAKQNLELWSQFAAKAVTPGEDDDDEDEEEEDDQDEEEDDDE